VRASPPDSSKRLQGETNVQGTIIAAPLLFLAALPVQAQQANMTFFITSTPIGNGGNLGGLAGATTSARHWRRPRVPVLPKSGVRISTQAADGKPAVNARDRIGKGPWTNAKATLSPKTLPIFTAPMR
jgi:hypothetical protein